MTARNTGDMPHVDMVVIDEDTVRYGGSFFRRERTCHMLPVKEGWYGHICDCCYTWFDEMKQKPQYCPNCGARVVTDDGKEG